MIQGEMWSHTVRNYTEVDTMGAIIGVLTTASAFYGQLWKRRIRIFAITGTLMFVLYSGQPEDLYRLISAMVGLGFGMLLQRRRPHSGWKRSSHYESRVLMASAVAMTAIGPVISLFTASRVGLLAPLGLLLSADGPASFSRSDRCSLLRITPGCVRELTIERISGAGPVLVTLIPLVILLLSAYGILRGRRFALWVAVAVNGLLSALSIFYFGLLPVINSTGHSSTSPNSKYWEIALSVVLSMLLPAAIAVYLILLRRHCTVPPPRGSTRAGLLTIAVSAVGLSALYLAIGLIFPHWFKPTIGFGDLLADLPERFVPVSFLRREASGFIPTEPLTIAVYNLIGPALWAITLAVLLVPMLTSHSTSNPAEETRAREILKRGGGSNLAFMALWQGNSWWFDPDSDTAIGYRVINNIAITTGEPFGPGSSSHYPVHLFARFCDDNGWTPVFYSVGDFYASTFEKMGWSVMTVAEETVLRPQTWSTTGKKWQDVRSSVNRAKREGTRSLWSTYRALPYALSIQITRMSEEWVSEKELPEMGFTLGGLEELKDPEVMLMLAIDKDEQVQGVTSWLPSYLNGEVIGWTLDFMRRNTDGPNGIMEFLIAEAAEQMRDSGIQSMSLSAAPLARTISGGKDDTATDRLLTYLSNSLEPVYGFKSLFAFKRKFQPEFHPILMAYPDNAALPAIGWALTRAYLPGASTQQLAKLARDAAGRSTSR